MLPRDVLDVTRNGAGQHRTARTLRFATLRLHDFDPAHLWHAYVTNLRTDSRFKDLVRDLGRVDYWRKAGNWGDFCKPVGKDDFECH